MRRCLAVLALALLTGSCVKEAPPEPPPHRAVVVKAGTLRFVPDLPAAQRSAVTSGIGSFLRTLYEDAFIQPKPAGQTPLPTTFRVVDRLTPLFAAAARPALVAHADAFTLGPHLDLLSGELTYTGGVTGQNALLQIHFAGAASRTDQGTPVMRVGQLGTMLLQHTEAGWFVREFDLHFRTIPAPTPTPS